MKWLVTGSSGYIGQHVILSMLENGFELVGMDAIKPDKDSNVASKIKHFQIDLMDTPEVMKLIQNEKCQGIINLAALKSVEESIKNPSTYFRVNCEAPMNLLKESSNYGIKYFIQSSTAAVYGNFKGDLADENSPTLPISPYGKSKLDFEEKLQRYTEDSDIRSTSLRFFNVLGSSGKSLRDKSRTNILPKIIDAISKGEKPKIFGTDYPTPDGTCVRDYVHVEDVAYAHTLAAARIVSTNLPPVMNLGTGKGHSVLEVIRKVEEVLGVSIDVEFAERRQGDVASLVASVDLARDFLSFKSNKSFHEMIESALK
jgi:UDP-glucose 4-epimerase